MKVKNRHRLTIIMFGVIFLICASIAVVSFAQSLEGFVNEGVSFDSILIGKSTESDVIAAYGKDYKLINHKGYSYEMIYKNLGLSFYYCQADPNKEIFTVEIEPPSKAMTSKGVKLGKSTLADVFRLYGEPEETSSGFEYEGVYFHYEESTEEEDSEDARSQLNTEVSGEKTKNTSAAVEDKSGSENNTVKETPNVRAEVLTQEVNLEADQTAEKEALKKKVVKRIELVEKDGLRQCDDKFPKK